MRGLVWRLLACLAAVLLPGSALEAAPVAGDLHCVAAVDGLGRDGELLLGGWTCYSDPSERDRLVAVLTASSLFHAGGDEDQVLTASFTLGVHYDGYNGSGSSLTVVGDSCSGGWWNTPSYFSNRISSSYHGCPKLRHYDLPNKGGASWTTTGLGSTVNLTSFNNRTESVQYLP